MDRVTDFESGGWGFDSLWGRFYFISGSTRNSGIAGEYAADHYLTFRGDHDRVNEK